MILVLLHPTSGYFEIQFYFEIHSEIAKIHVSGINELAQNREPVALTVSLLAINRHHASAKGGAQRRQCLDRDGRAARFG